MALSQESVSPSLREALTHKSQWEGIGHLVNHTCCETHENVELECITVQGAEEDKDGNDLSLPFAWYRTLLQKAFSLLSYHHFLFPNIQGTSIFVLRRLPLIYSSSASVSQNDVVAWEKRLQVHGIIGAARSFKGERIIWIIPLIVLRLILTFFSPPFFPFFCLFNLFFFTDLYDADINIFLYRLVGWCTGTYMYCLVEFARLPAYIMRQSFVCRPANDY